MKDSPNGSSKIPSPEAAVCKAGLCKTFGSFDTTKSSTYVNSVPGIDVPFSIAYLDKANANGTYFNDVVNMGGKTLKNVTMASVKSTDTESNAHNLQTLGVMGIGMDESESLTQNQFGTTYPNIVSNLVAQEVISTRAYSLFLNARGMQPNYYYDMF
jgi:hypothetical protein